MLIDGRRHRTIWVADDGRSVRAIDQRLLPHVVRVADLRTLEDAALAIETVLVTPDGSPAGNWAFDVTPARLVTGLVTERGVSPASEEGLRRLFPEAG